MTYAGQLRVADSEIDMHLRLCGSELERWAWLITKQFESATAVLIVARDSRKGEQFVAHVCYIHACRHRLQMMSSGGEYLATWPRSHAVFGQYHMGGTSAIDVAMRFAAGLWAEIETARLWSYPRCSVEDRELGDLAEWRSEFWKWLAANRPELAEWPLWSVHQERSRLRAAIAEEFHEATAKSGEASPPKVSGNANAGENLAEPPDGLTDEALLSFTQRAMMAFFRHWETVPGDEDLAKLDGKFTSFRTRPQFDQEFDQVLRCLFRTVAVGRTLGIDAIALRRFVEAFRHNDIEAAERGKYDASADIQRIQEALRSNAAEPSKALTDESSHLEPLSILRDRQMFFAQNPGLPSDFAGGVEKVRSELEAAGIAYSGNPVDWLRSTTGIREVERRWNLLREPSTPSESGLAVRTTEDGGDNESARTVAIAPGYSDPKQEERDRWIYEKCKAGLTNPQVIKKLEKISSARGWQYVGTDESIRAALKRYCLKTGAPELLGRKGGRPRRKTPKA